VVDLAVTHWFGETWLISLGEGERLVKKDVRGEERGRECMGEWFLDEGLDS
jgi:hypothetical protein